MDQEGLGLVHMPVERRDVDREAGFDVRLHAVFGGGVVGEELDCGLAVFGSQRVVTRGASFGDWSREEGEHGCAGLCGRF